MKRKSIKSIRSVKGRTTLYASSRGFTVVELIIYMGILIILLLVLTDMFASTLDLQLTSQSSSHIEQDSRFIVARLTRELMHAQNVTVPPNLGDTTQTLQFTSIGGVNYTYAAALGNLTVTDVQETNQLNSFNTTVSNMQFTRLGNTGGKPTIQIMFTLTSKTIRHQGPETQTIQTTVGLR